jgi:hypothetical protein
MLEAVKLAVEDEKTNINIFGKQAFAAKLQNIVQNKEILASEQRLMSEIGELRELLEAFMRVFLARVAQPVDKAAAQRASIEQFTEIRKFVDSRMNGNGNGR